MKIAIQLDSDVITQTLEAVAKGIGYEVVQNHGDADVVVTNDHRVMLACLKQGKHVMEYITHTEHDPASGLLTAYPNQFKSFRVIEGRGAEGTEEFIQHLLSLAGEQS